jgi:hypothetical protein
MQSGQMLQMQMHQPNMLHSAIKPMENIAENNDILRSAMVTPEIRQMTHENNILRTGLPLRHDSRPELIGHESKANMKANGPTPKTPMPIGHVRFAGAKKA